MRWSLRQQLMVPLVALVTASLLFVTAFNIYFARGAAQRQAAQRVESVAATLADANFPLSDSVLRQMHGLSAAHYSAVNDVGQCVATSWSAAELAEQPQLIQASWLERLPPKLPVELHGVAHYHSVLPIQRPGREELRLHVFLPVKNFQRAWSDAAWPSVVTGAAALILAAGWGVSLAARFARPINELRDKVNQIASGNFQPVELPLRQDELWELTRDVNRMVEMLRRYESDVRRNERLRTLGQLGGGIAHQLRNSATGCRMALEFHARACPAADREPLQVARRQLELMEEYIQRFLQIGRSATPVLHPVDLHQLVRDVLSLVQPTADHLGVQLGHDPIAQPGSSEPIKSLELLGDAGQLQQLIINLVLNACEAVGRPEWHRSGEAPSLPARQVLVRTGPLETGEIELIVADNGPGPIAELSEHLFEPLVTDKRDGVGLGLTVARDIVQQHGGQLNWTRTNGWTEFRAVWPASRVPSSETLS